MKKTLIKNVLRLIPVAVISCFTLSCGGSGSDEPAPVPDPVAAVLEFPANNEVCFDGTPVSGILSEVTFSWQSAEHTDSYELMITNLEDNGVKTYPAQTPGIQITLERGIPYQWSVKSLAKNSITEASSESWRFYLAGEGITSYAPFPAALLKPASGSTADPAGITFTWMGSDADSQNLSYELFVDTSDGKTEKIAGPMAVTFFETTLNPATVFYWSIVTKDPEGNSSRSAVYTFKTP